ncbi:unnamed protein product [Ranitomeya imitator]|uniref:Olfactory receptor n=1 Tax=Ranitomeya imitator TaxID=111125 RepID=A0ABN9MJ55_9NEOB|nr:unnamed protein product [Ranitomeya imitator]
MNKNEPTRKERVYFNSDILVPLTCIGIGYRYRRYPIFFEYRPIQTDTDTFRYRKVSLNTNPSTGTTVVFIISDETLHMMEHKNQTIFTEFILLGFTRDVKINLVLFILFLAIYIVTTVGNSLIIFMVITNPKMHKPMYFFLCMLSILDLGYSSTVLPKLLTDLFSTERIISPMACLIQIYVILFVEGSECQLLTVMAYDRYIAICRLLRYSVLMLWSICYRLVSLVFISSFMLTIFPSIFSPLTMCYNRINHFMCEMLAIITLSCEDIASSERNIFFVSFITLLLPLMLILMSYAAILAS